MLKQNPKTLIQANQVNVYIKNHWIFLKAKRLQLVIEGYKKLQSYIAKLIQAIECSYRNMPGETGRSDILDTSAYDNANPEQVEMQIHMILAILDGILIE